MIICRYRYRGVLFEGVTGDITDLEVDAIVNPANSYLLMGGGLAGVLKRRGGKIIEEEARKHAPLPIGEAVITSAGKLKAKYVIHAPTMVEPAGSTNPDNVYRATNAAIRTACDNKIKTIAVPGMGTGVGGLEPSEAVISMIRAMIEAVESGCRFEKVMVVDIREEIPRVFCELFKEVRGVEVLEDKS
jgi:O-acetyl-ADP-ribose deacetylase (regulator of RNase III)